MSEPGVTISEPRLRDALRPALLTFLAVRVGLTVLSAIAITVIPSRGALSVPGWGASQLAHGWAAVFTALERQDAQWFLRIAAGGYSPTDGSAAFFPLYPLLVRVVSWFVGGHPLLASMLVSNLAFFGALVVLYDLTVREFISRSRAGPSSTSRSSPRRSSSSRRTANRCSCCSRSSRSVKLGVTDGRPPRSPARSRR